MKFQDKYTNAKEGDIKKIEISDEAYALGEIIQVLIDKIEHVRVSLK